MLSSSQDRWLRWLCRVYGLMLWAYPPDFRGDYRREMLVVFRTGARDVMQREGSAALLPFMRQVSWDWLCTTLRERTTMTTSMPALRWVAALPLAILAAVAVMRIDGGGLQHTSEVLPRAKSASQVGHFAAQVIPGK